MKTHEQNEQFEAVRTFASVRGYSDEQINDGIAYAEAHGATDELEVASLMMSRILYSDAQLEDGERFVVESIED